MEIYDAEDIIEVSLLVNPVPNCPEVVAEMKIPGRLNPREDSLASCATDRGWFLCQRDPPVAPEVTTIPPWVHVSFLTCNGPDYSQAPEGTR